MSRDPHTPPHPARWFPPLWQGREGFRADCCWRNGGNSPEECMCGVCMYIYIYTYIYIYKNIYIYI